MQIFVTGATGFVGSAVVRELLAHGHRVLGLARSDASAQGLAALGAATLRGDLEAPETLQRGAERADAVLHLGFVHDFSRFGDACAIDRRAIDALGAAIEHTAKPLIVTAGVAALDTAGPVATEADPARAPTDAYPRASEAAANALSARGIATGIMRLPPTVHGDGDHGFVPMLIDIARRTGRSAYIEWGDNVWPAVHVRDAARAFRLAVERGPRAEIHHAVAEQGVAFRKIAEAIAAGLDLPCVSLSVDEARAHFGWMFEFAALDQPVSSARTRELLGWQPSEPGLMRDLAGPGYFATGRDPA
ncbi:SDR family oxidoreductase [Luteimonas sp BLCC-B24]|uniref:SDR family oxidoreductase n=1 Tax=Luteimonas sp. BLCC-B24 TaxID=3025317 RepID=UPI00234D1862|nr:SDR family oxidoreductase [Luteimonas sp. BLCC-B24]MDC7806740.1 SDR family oxidoreductase [Luteimonas sp. BLCC-B24]